MAVVDLAAAKAFLRINSNSEDSALPAFIDAAQASIEQRVGPLEPVEVTARVRGDSDALLLPRSPAVSLTSVTPVDGDVLDNADLYLEAASGVVTNNDGSGFGARYYTVVYQAGRATCPDDLVLAVKELLRHNWSSQRGPGRPGPQASEVTSTTVPGAAYLFPFAIEQRIAPHTQPGFA